MYLVSSGFLFQANLIIILIDPVQPRLSVQKGGSKIFNKIKSKPLVLYLYWCDERTDNFTGISLWARFTFIYPPPPPPPPPPRNVWDLFDFVPGTCLNMKSGCHHHQIWDGLHVGRHLILSLGLIQTWKVDATITKLGWTTYMPYIAPFSKWPPAKWNYVFAYYSASRIVKRQDFGF